MHMKDILIYGCPRMPFQCNSRVQERQPEGGISVSPAQDNSIDVTLNRSVLESRVRRLLGSRNKTRFLADTVYLTLKICIRGPTAPKKLTLVRLRKPLEPSLVRYEIPSHPEVTYPPFSWENSYCYMILGDSVTMQGLSSNRQDPQS